MKSAGLLGPPHRCQLPSARLQADAFSERKAHDGVALVRDLHAYARLLSHFNSYRAIYGVLGGMMLFMLWTYLAAIILLIGAEFLSELEKGRHQRPNDDEPVTPSP